MAATGDDESWLYGDEGKGEEGEKTPFLKVL